MDRITINTEKAQSIQEYANAQYCYEQGVQRLGESLFRLQETINEMIMPTTMQLQYLAEALNNMFTPYDEMYANIERSFLAAAYTVNKLSFPILSIYHDGISDDEKEEVNETNEKILTEIFRPDIEKKIDADESPIITLSPVNEQVLKYLSENPEAFYQLTDDDFEIVMAEIYAKLGYDVTRTQSSRDGGKDIIIRKPEIIGDFIYYVECKKYAPKRHIGVGIVRNLVGTVNIDRVNGGILATTSFFTRDARKLILDNKLDCQIKMQDYNVIQELLRMTVK